MFFESIIQFLLIRALTHVVKLCLVSNNDVLEKICKFFSFITRKTCWMQIDSDFAVMAMVRLRGKVSPAYQVRQKNSSPPRISCHFIRELAWNFRTKFYTLM